MGNKLVKRCLTSLAFGKNHFTLIRMTIILLLLLSCFSRVRLCATPEMAAHQAPPSLGFSRQEHWSGLPFPSPTIILTPPKMKMISIDEDVDKLEPMGNAFWNVKCGTSVIENSWAVPQILEHRITM